MPYSPLLIKPMREDLNATGVQELLTADDVDKALDQPGTTLVVVNSTCSCAADTARPAVQQVMAATSGKKPDRIVSVFAGQDLEATSRLRSKIQNYPPSSPCFALFKDKELVHFIPQSRIESSDANTVANDLLTVVQQHA